MKKLLILVSAFLLVGCSNTQNLVKRVENNDTPSTTIEETELTKKFKNVIMFIGDGMGPNHVDAGGVYLGKPLCFDDLNNEKWTYHAYSNTDSSTSQGFSFDTTRSLLRPELNETLYDAAESPYSGEYTSITTYTDSAAGATALACGVKVTNSRIGLDINGAPIENLVEIASGLGKKTGVVTSDNIVGATPSDFLVHVGERHMADDILNDAANSPADLILAQNVSNYTDKQSQYEQLYTSKGFEIAYNKNQLNKDAPRQLGLFDKVTYKDDPRVPTLEELTIYALDYLDNEEGFFLMVEGAGIDKKAHSNEAKLMLNELIGFNNAIEAATEWADAREDTLIVVTADHETGGLYYNRETTTQETIADDIQWLTYNHSRTRVDIAVYGDISEYVTKYGNHFSTLEGVPYWDNTDVFKLCSTYLKG